MNNNRSYFSQYKSPNIVIVPTTSYNPSSPKRRKIGNNIIVPIINDDDYDKQKIKSIQENEPDDSNADKLTDKNESSSKSPPLKRSWASNNLQSIGLDKQSSIWNRKIPRKLTPQADITNIEPLKKEITPSSLAPSNTGIEKNNQVDIPRKKVTHLNSFEVSTTKKIVKTQKCHTKDKLSKQELTSVLGKNSSDVKNVKTPIAYKKKNVQNESNKIKTGNPKNIESCEQPINLYCSDKRNLHKKSKKVVYTTAQKGLNFKHSTKYSSVKHGQKNESKVEKFNIKSKAINQNNKENNKKRNNNTRRHQTKGDSAMPSTSNLSNYKEKYKNLKCTVRNTTSMKNVKVKKKYDMSELKKLTVSKNAQHNTEPKTRVVRNKPEINKKIKTKEKLSKNKLDVTPNKKIKSPITRKIPKTTSCRKIKLVINLICNNQPNASQCNEKVTNESNNVNTACTVSNLDLDFLNDFDVDEIVESLDTCDNKTSQYILSDQEVNKCQNKRNLDRHHIIPNIHTVCGENTDVIDLIKTLKGEEDDDLMKICNENAKDILFSNDNREILTQGTENPHILDSVIKSGNCKISKNHSTNLIKIKEAKLSNINEDESGKKTQAIILKGKVEESRHDNTQSPSKSVMTNTTLGDLSFDLYDNENKNNTHVKEEKNVNQCDADSSVVFSKINIDLYKDITENINQEKCECFNVHKNKSTDLRNNPIDQHSAEINNENQNNNNLVISTAQKANAENIIDNKMFVDIDSANILQDEIRNNQLINSINKIKQNNNETNIFQQKPEDLIKENQKYDSKHEYKVSTNNKISTTVIKDVRNSDNQNNEDSQASEQKNSQSHCNLDINVSENTGDEKNNIIREELKISGGEVQKTKHEDDKEAPDTMGNFKENKQKKLLDNEIVKSQTVLSDTDENTRGKIISKADLETVLKLEERLFVYSGSRYSIISIIHTGRFSKIFKCKHPNGKHYALKMPTTNIKYNMGMEKKQMLNTLISDIPSNNLFIVCLAKAFNVGEKWCFLLDYYPKNLEQALCEAGKSFSIQHIQDYSRQLVKAVMVLRNKNMVHLDIKPKHILINSSSNMIKLCGFDSLSYVNKFRTLPNVGTVNYRAPEIILGYEAGFEIDVWSTGLVLYEIAANQKLFPGMYNNDILYKQICTLGCVPYDMIIKSRFSGVHFAGTKFMRKSGFKGQIVNIVNKFYKNNKLRDSIYDAYFENWGHHRSLSQQNIDIGKLSLFVKLLQKMLIIHPKYRLPIEFVYANPFIYDTYSYQE